MPKSVGEFVNFVLGDGSLVSEMELTYGSYFGGLNEAEKAWMIYQLGYQLWQDAEESVSDEVEEYVRLAQIKIKNIDKLGLIQFLAEQIKNG